ncbi:DUF2164 domain-containing protein [bacterium]|nr:DUF2164 domain-containing protein [bacterium]NCS67370.1 DUF2164 domain-containing protein [Candidatus Peregrinibacteria bacterium]NCS96625.1 DUF2164 domain-containing protein [bacterium]
MNHVRKNWDMLPDESRKTVIDELRRFYQTEFDEDLGVIRADLLLDKFLQLTAIEIYNEGVDSTERLVEDKIGDLKMELYMLRKSPSD